MKKKTQSLAAETDLLVDLTFHSVPVSLFSEFAEKTVKSCYIGNMHAVIQEILKKIIEEQDLILSHITHIRNPLGTQ